MAENYLLQKLRRAFLLVLLTLLAGSAFALTAHKPGTKPVPVVMLSDLHFDPLREPGKAARLAAAPLADWPAILREPAGRLQTEAFAAMQKVCLARGLDSDYSLLTHALDAARTQPARFVTVTGDLLVHQFECRWKVATGSSDGYADFAEKTSDFVLSQVQAAFPRSAVYVALGNNDSACGDYQLDLQDRYLRHTSSVVMAGLRGANAADRAAALVDYQNFGAFSVAMPGVRAARLLILDDMYLSAKYRSCANKKGDIAAGEALLAWLHGQLTKAQAHGVAVWVLGHVPPGIDVYNTISKLRDVCGGAEPELFLASDALAKLLSAYPRTVRLALFGHTHSDELRLLDGVPVKLVGSVTPINGNLPSYTAAQVDAQNAELQDYQVYVAPDQAGTGPWAREYDFDQTYSVQKFTAATLSTILAGFRNDPNATQPASQNYERAFTPGMQSPLSLIWPQATCALGSATAEQYRCCTCKK